MTNNDTNTKPINDYFACVSGNLLASKLAPTTKIILINLIGRAGIEGYTVSPSNVSKETSIPLNTVMRHFELLITMGVLTFLKYGYGKTTHYKKYAINREVLATVNEQGATSILGPATSTMEPISNICTSNIDQVVQAATRPERPAIPSVSAPLERVVGNNNGETPTLELPQEDNKATSTMRVAIPSRSLNDMIESGRELTRKLSKGRR